MHDDVGVGEVSLTPLSRKVTYGESNTTNSC